METSAPAASTGSIKQTAELAQAFKALADPTRVQLVSIIARQPGAEACVCDLTEPVSLSQPTVSHHLKILVDAGLLAREQRGRWAYYSVVQDRFSVISGALTDLSGMPGR
ncbi:metalloregulator ArsR/SmtB family transcription factor [Ornithinimicrobium sp. INDO-MA30-4]|uniref:ArsR/SmtB family transcription factor n=1 Tax=Ornithinimicrobium sp. INDO-MA30-4 TaxID=2908651 RepID=UPI001F305392|nr:metalloregulator ArsR/SmtB family transcription factor [Ornithinimicrobium sp. INDO-MA30-4]UJH71096.1 metalloregulator ArsR/SmtB family transcription factor [Ornithinimicrobium sp. INDO-MA30-4]